MRHDVTSPKPLQRTKPRILFCVNKWSNGRQEYGPSEYEEGIARSLESTELADATFFHFDTFAESIPISEIQEALLRLCTAERPDLLFVVEAAKTKLDLTTYQTLAHEMKVPIVCMWGDIQEPDQLRRTHELLSYVRLHVVTGSAAAYLRCLRKEKYFYAWVPKDPRSFFPPDPGATRDIEVSFIGSTRFRKDRRRTMDFLRRNGVDVFLSGGEQEQHVSLETYTDILRRSKVVLSFSRSTYGMTCMNARPYEALSCGALLLEEQGFETVKMFVPGQEYVPFSSRHDLLRKIRRLLSDEAVRSEIARQGNARCARDYSAERFWRLVIDEALHGSHSIGVRELDAYRRELSVFPWPITRGLPLGVRIQLFLAHSLYVHRWSFAVWRALRKGKSHALVGIRHLLQRVRH